ncbi:unnamed protein product [Paramecium octaurelia]|uniref:Protein kinase domain-containing protein n=1 Tax=Paramecium octaurelia TaxID=43137 RepID=A0A8S1UVG3_PAROT|nr:unnamed protein product [Paramecium octaurelia]
MKGHYSSVCDIQSFGLVFNLLLTGKSPFPGQIYATIAKQIEIMLLILRVERLKKGITSYQCFNHPFIQLINRCFETIKMILQMKEKKVKYVQDECIK